MSRLGWFCVWMMCCCAVSCGEDVEPFVVGEIDSLNRESYIESGPIERWSEGTPECGVPSPGDNRGPVVVWRNRGVQQDLVLVRLDAQCNEVESRIVERSQSVSSSTNPGEVWVVRGAESGTEHSRWNIPGGGDKAVVVLFER